MMIPRLGKKSLATECRHLVQVQDRVSVPDDEGGNVLYWQGREPSVWAAISPIRADQRAEMKTYNVHVTHHVKLRGRVPISDGGENRILWGSRVFQVETAEDLQERGIMTLCTCKEIRTRGENN